MAQKLPQPIFTPATKAEVGDHDENVSFEQAAANCDATLNDLLKGTGKTGAQLCAEARDAAIRLYQEASDYAATRGIIIADTKFEFGIDAAGTLHLIDEALTPDSSRFWPADQYSRRQQPAVLRQAIRPRLPGNPRLGQGCARTEATRRGHRPHQRQIHRGL
jgi:phosphoribosylaminoimidazole-succinocarboxamide synthase